MSVEKADLLTPDPGPFLWADDEIECLGCGAGDVLQREG